MKLVDAWDERGMSTPSVAGMDDPNAKQSRWWWLNDGEERVYVDEFELQRYGLHWITWHHLTVGSPLRIPHVRCLYIVILTRQAACVRVHVSYLPFFWDLYVKNKLHLLEYIYLQLRIQENFSPPPLPLWDIAFYSNNNNIGFSYNCL